MRKELVYAYNWVFPQKTNYNISCSFLNLFIHSKMQGAKGYDNPN